MTSTVGVSPNTIVLIPGLWMTPLCWENWIPRMESRGFTVLAPAWPKMDGPIEDLRKNPSTVAGLTVSKIVDSYDRIIRALDTPPIIIGHSFGGAFTQVLVSRGLGAAAVAIDSAAPKGVLSLPISTLRSSWPVLRNPLNRKKAIGLTPAQFHYAFANTMTEQESQAAYDRYAVPGPAHVLFEGAMANFSPHSALTVDYKKSNRAPLLLIAGGSDHIVPASTNRANLKKYANSKAKTEYKEFPGRAHFTLGQAGWEEVADYALNWAIGQTAATSQL